MARFFVSCPLGFETSLATEIKNFWFEMIDLDGLPTRAEFPELEILQGGVEFETDDHLGFQINFFSKLANRVLLRIAKFESRYYDQFEKELSKIDLEKYLDFDYLNHQLQVKIESHKSRLNNEKNLNEAFSHVLDKKKIKISDKARQTLFIRIEKDRVTVSLDTSGEHLHRRGYASHRGEAPLRETLAAYLVTHLNLSSRLRLIDPFAGSGTLLFEAISQNLPNLQRDYSWLHFKNAPKLFKSDSWRKNYRWFASQNAMECVGYDIDEKSVQNAKHNQSDFQKIFSLENINLNFKVQNSAELKLENPENKNTWLIANPPYGIRLADEQAKETLEMLENGVNGIVVIHPEKWKFNFKKLKLSHQQDFSNQGLNLKLSVFTG
ncbi:MAG: THUMP domain-containing class I SAM-dependent RNA methyltransferase [Pseudobdellovibrio sp.]